MVVSLGDLWQYRIVALFRLVPWNICVLSKGIECRRGSSWEKIEKKNMLSCCILYVVSCFSAEHSTKVTELAPFLLSLPAGEVRCEPPNNKLDKFSGILTYLGDNYFLDHDRLLLRGCIIRNTDWCYGLVIYTGMLLAARTRPGLLEPSHHSVRIRI